MLPARAPARLDARLRVRRLEDRTVPSTSIPLNAYNWAPLGPAPITSGTAPGTLSSSGRVTAVAAHPTDPNTLYVGSANGGVWKTTNADAAAPTWTPLTDGQATLTTGDIALAPSNPNVLYVGTGEANNSADSFYGRGVLKSTDAGATWTLLTHGGAFDRKVASRVTVHPTDPDTVFAAFTGTGTNATGGGTGVYRSTDGGATWTLLTGALGTTESYSDFEVDPTNPNVGYLAIGSAFGSAANGVYTTTNLLAAAPTWTRVPTVTSGNANGRTLIALARSNPPTLYVAIVSPTSFGLARYYQSVDGGASWTDRTATTPDFCAGRGFYGLGLAVDPSNPNAVVASGTTGANRLIHSGDGGATWSSLIPTGNAPHVDHHALAFDAAGRLVDCDDGGVYRLNNFAPRVWASLNGTSSGTATPTALNTSQFTGIALHPTDINRIIGGAQGNGTQRFNDNLGWSTVDGGDGGDVAWDATSPNFVYRTAPVASFGASGFVRRSTNGGTSFAPMTGGIVNAASAPLYPPLAPDPAPGSHRLFLGTNVVNVLADATVASPVWTQYGVALPGTASIAAIGIGASNPNTLYVAAGGSVFVTTDAGATWQTRTPAGTGGSYADFAVDPTDSNVAYVVSASFDGASRVYRTVNAGVTWASVQGLGLPNVPAWSVALDPGPTGASTDDVVFVGNDQGVYRSTDRGATWVRYGALLPAVQVRDLEFNAQLGVLAAGTYGRGVWEIGTRIIANSVNGTKYNDLNGNGVRNPGEPGLADWTVYADANNDGVYQAPVTNTFTQSTPMPIPDVSTATSPLAVTVPAGRVVTDVNVTLNLTHPRDADLRVTLVSPAGTRVLLFNAVGGTGQNFIATVLDDSAATPIASGTAPFTGSFRPAELLSAFIGEPGNGTWTLEVIDQATGAVGSIDSWLLAVAGGELAATTDTAGHYRITGLRAGTTTIREVAQPGFRPTGPAGGFYTASFASAASPAAVGFDFGAVVDGVAPTVTGVTPTDPNPTSAPSVTYAVAFSEAVTGLSAANFSLVTVGISGAAVVGVAGSGSAYTVTVATGLGDGTIQLRLANSTGLTDLALNPVANVPFDGGTYTVARGSPTPTFSVNDGTLAQRSRVAFLTVTFNEAVTFAGGVANAFALRTLAGAVVSFTASAQTVGGVTVVTITPTGNVSFGSLNDGRYTLTLLAGTAADGGGTLNAEARFDFFRLFGDANGDGVINAFDFGQFRPAFGSSAGQATYVDWLDFDNDGVINAFDFAQFRTRFARGVP